MKAVITFTLLLLVLGGYSQAGWKICNAPAFGNRVDDLFMLNTQVGYAVSGDGRIVKTTDGGENWVQLLQNTSVYCRSVEFVNEQKGFVGAFSFNAGAANILRIAVWF